MYRCNGAIRTLYSFRLKFKYRRNDFKWSHHLFNFFHLKSQPYNRNEISRWVQEMKVAITKEPTNIWSWMRITIHVTPDFVITIITWRNNHTCDFRFKGDVCNNYTLDILDSWEYRRCKDILKFATDFYRLYAQQ